MNDFIYTPPQHPLLNIIFHDEDIAVFNKPSGLLSVPGRALTHQDSLALRALQRWEEAKVVHRLDMATSGLMVMALHREAQSHLGRQFQQRVPQKKYHAEIWGHPASANGSIDLPLRCDWPNRPRQMVDHEQGKHALTHWQIIELREQTALVELMPVTGRSHQLRVHMLSIGHVIIGDTLYANGPALNAAPRLHLHASELSFYHPRTNKWLHFESALPF